MKIELEFVVARSPDVVWDLFQDVPSVAQCLPGAELLGQSDDGTYDGKLTVKLGPMSAAFEGKATVTPEPEARKATIEGKGVDKRGGSRGQVKVVYAITPEETGSRVSIEAELTLSGPAAQFGRTGLINEMSKRLIVEFASCLEAKLKAETGEEAAEIKSSEVRGLSLFFASLWASIKKLFKSGE
jgi:carbon monoxide dehydrogenase subunit G